MSVPAELKSATRKLLDLLLVCKPIDAVGFAQHFYNDERSAKPSVSHAIHSLMFLLRRPEDFRDAMGTIYSLEVLNQSKESDSKKQGTGKKEKDVNKDIKEKEELDGSRPTSSSGAETGTDNDGAEVDDASKSKDSSYKGSVNAKRVATDRENALNTLCTIARTAVMAAARSAKCPLDTDNDGADAKDELCSVIESNIVTELLSTDCGDPIDFESCLAFVRTYLCLRLIAGSIQEQLAKKTHKDGTIFSLEVTAEKLVTDEDKALLEQIITTCSAKYTENEKIVNSAISQYFQLLTRSEAK
jgi:hypothetical protein